MDVRSLKSLSLTCKALFLLIAECRQKYLRLRLSRLILTNERKSSGWMKNYINFRFLLPKTCQHLTVDSLKIRNAIVDDTFCKLLRMFCLQNDVKAKSVQFVSCDFRSKFNYILYCLRPCGASHISTTFSHKTIVSSKSLKKMNQVISCCWCGRQAVVKLAGKLAEGKQIRQQPLSLINCIVASGEIILEEAQTISSDIINKLLKIWLTQDTFCCLKKCSLKTVNELDVSRIVENLNVIRSCSDGANKMTQIYLKPLNTSEYLWICVGRQSFVGEIII